MTAADDSIDTGAGGSVLLRHITAQAARRAAERAAAGRPDPVVPPVPVPRGPDRVIASAIGRAADRVHGMPLFFDRVSVGHAVLAEVPELLPEQALILAVEGPGGAMGTAAICPGLLSSLIEMQAMGRITARPVEARRATRADAAIAADFVNLLLEEYAASVAPLPGQAALAGFRYASYLDDPRPLALMLEDGGLRALSIGLRLGPGGERRGSLFVAVPATEGGGLPAPKPASAPRAAALNDEAPGAAGHATQRVLLSDAMRAAPVAVVGVLCRRPIRLRELRSLKPGHVLTLPRGALADCTLETAQGQTLARGRLGEQDGRHALRLRGAGQCREAGQEPFHVQDGQQEAAAVAAEADIHGCAPPLDLSVQDAFREAAGAGGPVVLPMQAVAS